MLNKFTEVYYCDAMRFAKYIQSNHGGDIREVVTSPEGFPTEPKGYEFGDTVHALKIGAYEIAFFTKEEPQEGYAKDRNRNIYRFVLGEQLMDMRISKGISVEELAKIVHLTKSTINNLEHGRMDVQLKIWGNVAEALGCTIGLVSKWD